MSTQVSLKPFKATVDLTVFAADFAKKFKTLKEGHYYSGSEGWELEYRDFEERDEKEVIRFSVSEGLHYMQFNRSLVLEMDYSAHFIFYGVIWCAAAIHYHRAGVTDFLDQADHHALKYYFTTARDINVLKIDLVNLLSFSSVPGAMPRLQKILNIIDARQKYVGQNISFERDDDKKTITLGPQHLQGKPYKRYLNKELLLHEIRLSHIAHNTLILLNTYWFTKGYQVRFKAGDKTKDLT